MTKNQLNKNIKIVSYSSIVGFSLVCYDRVFIRGIDYSLGLRHARYQWLNSEGGSLPSIIGNLLIPFGYICIFFLIMHYSCISKKSKYLLLVSSIVSVFGHSALNGGRSNVLLALILVVITVLIKSEQSKKMFSFKLKSLKILPILGMVVGYVSLIIISSAAMGNARLKTLAQLGVESLYGQVGGFFNELEQISQYLYLIIYSIAYLYHGQWTAQVAYSLPDRDGNYTFYSFGIILNRLGLISEPIKSGYFSETGAFISLPGAFYYDFGFLGVIILSSIIGLMFGLVMIILNYSRTIGGTKLAFIIYILFILLLSPILPAYGFSYLHFIIFAFVSLDFINRILFRRRSNWLKVE